MAANVGNTFTTETAPLTVPSRQQTPRRFPTVTTAANAALRTAAVCVLGGVIAGFAVGGIGGRLAMLVLAVLNPSANNMISDDGFRIGHLTLSGTANLLALATVLGAFGGLVYALVRPLRLGPRWFQLASLSFGPGVVVGSLLVHSDGFDFRFLEPAELAIALFVAIPALYAATLTLLVEHWLRPGAWPARAHRLVALLPLVALAPLLPLAGAIAIGWLAHHLFLATPAGRVVAGHAAVPWLLRGALTFVFIVALIDLLEDTATLT